MNNFADEVILSSTEDAFTIKSVKVESEGKMIVDSCEVTVCVDVDSHFPKPLLCSYVEIAILPSDPHPLPLQNQSTVAAKTSRRLSAGQSLKEGKGRLDRKESLLPITCEDEDLLLNHNDLNHTNLRLELGQIFETKQDKSIQGGKITCHNSHLALR
jgi:hypothetical protein